MRAELAGTVARSRVYVARAQEILLPNHPDAYLGLMRTTLPPRFGHHSLCVPPSVVRSAAHDFDQLVLGTWYCNFNQIISGILLQDPPN